MTKAQKLSSFILASMFLFVFAFPAFAQEAAEAAEKSPVWFPMLEIGGVIIAVLTVISMSQAAGAAAGGKLSKVFMSFVYGSVLIATALLWRAYTEITGQEGGFASELVYEIILYAGLICLAFGGWMAKRLLTAVK